MLASVLEKRYITPSLFVLRLEASEISRLVTAGQFVNVLPRSSGFDPLLRRPFSIYNRSDNWIEIIVQIHGKGTLELSYLSVGEICDVVGPLGMPWDINSSDYTTAILVVGGVGVASMPLLTQQLQAQDTPFETYYGARSANLFADEYLHNVHYATDDGSKGSTGNVITLLREHLSQLLYEAPKLFVCGPTRMMQAAAALAKDFSIPCEVSLETEMACGVGICQGCPVQTTEEELADTGKKFHLVCTHGPSFDYKKIVF